MAGFIHSSWISLKIQAARVSENSVIMYQSTRRHIAEDLTVYPFLRHSSIQTEQKLHLSLRTETYSGSTQFLAGVLNRGGMGRG
jgi:hypothetical protein